MNDISELKLKLASLIAKRDCGIEDYQMCDKSHCQCSLLAEVQAIKYSVIPKGFRNYTIRDFNGMDRKGRKLLSSSGAVKVGDQLSQFCWNCNLSEARKMDRSQLIQKSVIGKRIRKGTNIVIHGESAWGVQKDEEGRDYKIEKPLGRSLVASLLTKEAINLRAVKGYHTLSYDWCEFPVLKRSLDNEDTCNEFFVHDWLVIDGIDKHDFGGSERQKTYIAGKLDPFFFSRLSSKYSTIFIFQFDISFEAKRIEETFGRGMARAVYGDDTVHIKLIAGGSDE